MSPASFDATTPPNEKALAEAETLKVYTESGSEVTLASLYKDQKTIVVFIRHFYCGLCQDYVQYLAEKIRPEVLEKAGVQLVIVGCGDWSLIKPYRELLSCPFPIYADLTKKTYVAWGMTLRTLDQGGSTNVPEYLKHTGMGNVFVSIMNAFRLGKLSAKSGDIKQLGGEFVCGPGNEVHYTHRMENTKGHAPLAELLSAAGLPSSEVAEVKA